MRSGTKAICCSGRMYLAIMAILLSAIPARSGEQPMRLWYDEPAENWNEALPLGNGRIGAMVFGNPQRERIQLNEETFWGGGPHRNDNPDARAVMDSIRDFIFAGNYREANKLAAEKVITRLNHGCPYLPVADVFLDFPGHDNAKDYYRELDIGRAVYSSGYSVKGITFRRECFVSFPNQVFVMHITADQPGKLNFNATITSPFKETLSRMADNRLRLAGRGRDHQGVAGQVTFCADMVVDIEDGIITASDTLLIITGATEAIIRISIATNFRDYRTLDRNPAAISEGILEQSEHAPFEILRDAHVAFYRSFFDRVVLDIGTTEAAQKTTDERIREFSTSDDPGLVSLYFQFGRYLLISSSQPGGQPATLQGIWNDQVDPPWDSKYTININTEMNYWPSEVTNLTELNEPLIRMVRELSEAGRQTAQTMYGVSGWVVHHNTDIWRMAAPIDGPWGLWPSGGAWLCQHLWEKYLYSGDMEYLRSVYPVMKESARFYLNVLVTDPRNGWLVLSPSTSPENAHPEGFALDAGCTMDNQLLFDLFSNVISFSEMLGLDAPLRGELEHARSLLPPMHIGKHGQLQEWLADWDDPSDKHRHVSHLYGLYPGNQISPWRTPELFDAARTSLIFRGDVSTGWSMGWKVNLWARLLDGDHAFKLLRDQLSPAVGPDGNHRGGTYPNLFDSHPPFQIDGNFGCTAGIAEMLMQSHDGSIHILPALPGQWKNGRVSGLRARGGFELDFEWQNGRLARLKLISRLGGSCRIRVAEKPRSPGPEVLSEAADPNPNPFYRTPEIKHPVISPEAKRNDVTLNTYYVFDLPTQAGRAYEVEF